MPDARHVASHAGGSVAQRRRRVLCSEQSRQHQACAIYGGCIRAVNSRLSSAVSACMPDSSTSRAVSACLPVCLGSITAARITAALGHSLGFIAVSAGVGQFRPGHLYWALSLAT